VEEVCKEKEAKLAKLNDRINHMSALGLVFNQYIKRSAEMHGCPACKRGFSAPEEEAFIENQKESRDSIPQRLEQAKEARDKLQKSIDEMKSKASVVEELKQMRRELLECQAKQAEDLKTKGELEKRVNEAKEGEASLAQQLATNRRLLQDVVIPAGNFLATIQETESALAATKGGLDLKQSRSIEEVKSALGECEKELKARSALKEERRAALMRANEEVGACERSLREHRDMVAKAEGNAIELKTKLKEREKLQREISDLEKEEDSLAKSLVHLKADLREVKADSDAQTASMQKKVNAFDDETQETVRDAESVKSLCEKLASHDIERREKQLVKLQTEQAELKEAISRIDKNISEGKETLRSHEQTLAERDVFSRNLDDNIAYKRGVEEARHSAMALHDLEQRLAAMSAGEEETGETLREAKAKYEEASRKKQYLLGSRKTLEQKVSEREEELRNKEFRNIDENFRKENLALKTKQLAIADIDNYVKALKKALITFHNRKMANINKTIKELWQKTYRNSDIDYIQIKYEESGSRGSHNYRVQMISGGTKLDMRGRCSAGQRVLASIIIRLALAETFCIDCGILALDEPTTNLDEENSRSLAVMLQQIIKDRSAQSNFQLIVITHDEKFAQMIGRRQFCSHYWYVHKDENQHTKLLMQEVQD